MTAAMLAAAFLTSKWGAVVGGKTEAPDDKIVGGFEVWDIKEMPYIVAINKAKRNCTLGAGGKTACEERWHYHCAGSLLSPFYVITACHCMATFENARQHKAAILKHSRAGDWRYIAGSRSMGLLERTAQTRIPSELHPHPDCAREFIMVMYDIGIAKMTEPFSINEFVRPVKLFGFERGKFKVEVGNMLQRNPKCRVSGWGSTERERLRVKADETTRYGHEAKLLKTAKMTVLSQNECHRRFKVWTHHDFDRSAMDFDKFDQLCISSPSGTEGFCSGDSGGPFVCDGYLVAVVSNSMECGTALPQICQTVAGLIDWIRRDFCTETDCSDIITERDSGKTNASPHRKLKRARGGAEWSVVTEVNPSTVTVLIHLVINLMKLF